MGVGRKGAPLVRLGVFGGTFDPPHIGHLVIAEQAMGQLGLDRVLFVPVGVPPHKLAEAVTPAEVRLEMVRAAVAGNPGFAISDMEVRRAGPSFTVDTLCTLRTCRPDDEVFCLIGSDSAVQLHTWHDPGRLYRMATFAVVMRPGWPSAQLDTWLATQPPAMRPRFRIVEVPLLAVASRDLREAAAAGRSIRYLVPEAVRLVIARHGLYQGGSGHAAEP